MDLRATGRAPLGGTSAPEFHAHRERRSGVRGLKGTLSTLAFARVGTTLLLVLDELDPASSDWTTWTAACVDAARNGLGGLLVVSAGGGPSIAQRRETMAALVQGVGTEFADAGRIAVCGDSSSVRSMTATLGWLYGVRNLKLFAHDRQRDALQFLVREAVSHTEILHAIKHLERELRERR